MISVNQDLDDDEADVYVMAPEMWQPDVLTPTADEDPLTDSRKSHVGVVFTSMGNKGHKSKYASEQSAKDVGNAILSTGSQLCFQTGDHDRSFPTCRQEI